MLADQEFYRVGGHTPVRVEVRIIAATHQDLGRRVRDGRFREDLFHRLNVIGVRVPALRERPEDIVTLARHFLAEAAAELGVERKVLLPETEEHLTGLAWPGNVRQIQNTCRWLTVMAAGREVRTGDLPPELRAPEGGHEGEGAGGEEGAGGAAEGSLPLSPSGDDWERALARWAEERLRAGGTRLMDDAGPRFERVLIDAALRHSGGLRHEAARLLGWGRNTLTRKLSRSSEPPPGG